MIITLYFNPQTFESDPTNLIKKIISLSNLWAKLSTPMTDDG